ncbi:MAG: squalene/phytoene synthase family protein [Pseudomonadota bacterium]
MGDRPATAPSDRQELPPIDAVAQSARAHEFDLYLTALLMPAAVRADAIAIAAFVGELNRVPMFVSEPLIGEIRLQWWRDALEAGVDGKQSGNPILDAVTTTARNHALPIGLFQGIIDAQSLGLTDAPPEDEMALRQHLAKVFGGAFALLARLIDRDGARAHAEWVRDAGIAYGTARAALEFPALLAQGRVLVPQSWLDEEGVSVDALRTSAGDIAARLLDRMVQSSKSLGDKLARQPVKPTRAVRRACRPLAMVAPYSNVVGRSGFASGQMAGDVSPLRRVWAIWRGVR